MERRLPVRKKRKKSKAVTITISVIVSLITLFILGLLITNIWINRNYFVVIVDGQSMHDTLQTQDRLYASYKVNAQRGDIIIIDATKYPRFANADGSEKLLVKRLIALEGDTVECKEGVVYLNGEVLAEPYLNQPTPDFKNVTVGEGEIFFLGDNRNNSSDSEELVKHGENFLKYEDIVGVVPKWAVRNKGTITGWEKFRKSVSDFFSVGTIHRTGE